MSAIDSINRADPVLVRSLQKWRAVALMMRYEKELSTTYLVLVLLDLVGALALDKSLGGAPTSEYLILVLEDHVYLLSELAGS